MGRIFPPDYHHHHHYSTFPLLSLSLFILSIATTLSIVTALCGFLNRKEEGGAEVGVDKDGDNSEKNKGGETLMSPTANNGEAQDEAAAEVGEGQNDDGSMNQPLPPPPSMRSASYHYRSSSQASPGPAHTKLASSMSMRVPGMGSRQASKRDDVFGGGGGGDKKRDKKLKHEDSIWKKTIILGEKCKVHDEDEDEILYDEEGNRITPYHPKTSSTVPMSRQSSAIDEDALPR